MCENKLWKKKNFYTAKSFMLKRYANFFNNNKNLVLEISKKYILFNLARRLINHKKN